MKQFTLLIIAYFISEPPFAQTTFSTLTDVYTYADKYSSITKQGAVREGINISEEGIAKSALLPKVNVFGSAEYYPVIGSMVVPGKLLGARDDSYHKVQFGLPYNFWTGVEVSMPVINFEKWEQLKLIRLQSVSNNLDTKTHLENLHVNLAQLYYRALLYKQLIQLNDESEKVTAELMRIMEQRKKNGILSPHDYNRSQNLSFEVINAGIEYGKLYDLTLNNLKAAININSTETIVLKETIPEVEAALLREETDITKRAAFKQAEAQVAVANQALAASKKSALPKLSFHGRYAHQLQAKPGKESQQINFDVSSLGLRLDVPLFAGKYYKLQTQKSNDQYQLAKLQQEQVERSLEQEQTTWKTNYNAALRKQPQLKRKTELAADNLRIAQLSFKEGVMEFDEFNNVFLEHLRAQTESLQNTTDGLVYKLLLTINITTL